MATIEQAIEIVRREWDRQGACASCGWHAAIEEYGDLTDAIDIDERRGRIELSCLSKDENGADHRGVRIYFDQASLNTGAGE